MLAFWPSDVVLIAVQAALIGAPLPHLPDALIRRLHGNIWAWVLPVSLGGTIALLALLPGLASAYTWFALVGVPVGAAVALSTRLHPAVAVGLVVALSIVAWDARTALAGQGAAVVLTALSCVALAGYLADLASVSALRLGIVAMAILDAVLVFGHLLQAPNQTLNAAAPAPGLPQLQVAVFGSALMGYGDLFVAAVLGAVLARQGLRRLSVVVLAFVLSGLFDLLFLVTATLPATVPIAATMLGSMLFGGLLSGLGRVRRPDQSGSRRNSGRGTCRSADIT